MVHRCKVFCHLIDPEQMELMGLDEKTDQGKWLPFSVRMDVVQMCKLTSDEPDHPTMGCTSLFVENGDTYIINTPYEKFSALFESYFSEEAPSEDEQEDDDTL